MRNLIKNMNDLKQFQHGEEGTHWVCEKRLKKEGSKSRCCECETHEDHEEEKWRRNELDRYEMPIPAELAGKVKGDFPNFIPKTDDTPISVSEKLVKEDIRKLTQNSEEIKKLKEQVDRKKDKKSKKQSRKRDVPSEISHCVQCGGEMPYGTDWDKFVQVCHNPACPNFGLLQMGIEKMKKL